MNSIQTDWLKRWAEYSPIKMAVKDGDTGDSLTYRQLNDEAEIFAMRLFLLGLKKGDRIAVVSEFSLAYIILCGAALKAGFILVPLNYRLAGPEIDYMIGDSQSMIVLYQEKYKYLLAGKENFEACSHTFEIAGFASEARTVEVSSSILRVDGIELSDPLFILYTSGTTGFPKGALYTHGMAFWNSINTQLRLDITADDHTITCMPPFHTGGWNVLLTPFLHHGASITIIRKFEADTVLKMLEAEECTLFMGVPTMLKMMAGGDVFEKVNLSSLRYFIVGGEAMPLPLIEKFQEKGTPIRQGYGLTEAGPNITSLHHDDAIRKKGSIGKPNFYVSYRLVDENGNDVGVGEEGEFWLKGPMVTPGYWNNDEATVSSFAGGWFKTGDILTRDEEGYLYVKDRIKNMFISGGENVYPAEVEKTLQQHPSIKDVAVIGVSDPKWGEVGKALIVSDELINLEDIVDFCRDKLAKFKIPKHLQTVKDLPRNDSGKLDRKALLKQSH